MVNVAQKQQKTSQLEFTLTYQLLSTDREERMQKQNYQQTVAISEMKPLPVEIWRLKTARLQVEIEYV